MSNIASPTHIVADDNEFWYFWQTLLPRSVCFQRCEYCFAKYCRLRQNMPKLFALRERERERERERDFLSWKFIFKLKSHVWKFLGWQRVFQFSTFSQLFVLNIFYWERLGTSYKNFRVRFPIYAGRTLALFYFGSVWIRIALFFFSKHWLTNSWNINMTSIFVLLILSSLERSKIVQ